MATERQRTISDPLTVAAVSLALLVMGLGAAVIVVKVRAYGPKAGSAQASAAGQDLADAGSPEKACEAFDKAIKLNPKNGVALVRLGLLLSGLDPAQCEKTDPARAERLLEKGSPLVVPGNKALGYIALGDLRLKRGDAAGAKKAYEAAIKDVPVYVEGHVGLARALEALGDPKGALEHYRKAKLFAPGNSEIAAAIARLSKSPGGE